MSFGVEEILQWTQGRVVNTAECASFLRSARVERPASLKNSLQNEIAYFFATQYKEELPHANPGILITGDAFVKPLEVSGLPLWKKSVVIACSDPYWAMAFLSKQFAKNLSTVSHVPQGGGRDTKRVTKTEIHPTALISPLAEIGAGVRVGAYCVVDEGTRIGAGSVLYPHCSIGPGVSLGEECVLFSNVSIYEKTQIGNRVRIHAGSVIGSDGFGYAPIRSRNPAGQTIVIGHEKIYHLGHVVIGDDVEIGANSCVDRGTIGETRIEKNAKLDNLVQIAHNAKVDEGGIVCGGTCLAGGSSVGKYAYVGGLTGVANQVHIGDGAQVSALALVTKDVPPGGTAVGSPQREYREHFKAHALLSRLLEERSGKRAKHVEKE